jgi:hypothetical protein
MARAKALLVVADGAPVTEAAGVAGWQAGDPVAHLVEPCNALGVAILDRRSGGGPPVRYGPLERERISQRTCQPATRMTGDSLIDPKASRPLNQGCNQCTNVLASALIG